MKGFEIFKNGGVEFPMYQAQGMWTKKFNLRYRVNNRWNTRIVKLKVCSYGVGAFWPFSLSLRTGRAVPSLKVRSGKGGDAQQASDT